MQGKGRHILFIQGYHTVVAHGPDEGGTPKGEGIIRPLYFSVRLSVSLNIVYFWQD